jgi:murein DD-endopeptidase MepM/ murein hydrolase activator NlpD
MADALGRLNEPPRRGLVTLSIQHSWPLLADGFDFPVGKPDARDYYVVSGLVEPAHYEKHQLWNTGEDWVRRPGPVDSAAVGLGDPVYAVAHGRAVTARAFANRGQIVLVEHRLPWGQTVWSQYACLQERYVRRGDVVRRGDQIGTMGKGNGGYAAHLHFEIRLRRLPASKWDWKLQEDRAKVLRAYAYPTQFINSHRPG